MNKQFIITEAVSDADLQLVRDIRICLYFKSYNNFNITKLGKYRQYRVSHKRDNIQKIIIFNQKRKISIT